ncbi:MAG: alpha/beta fold hydrolase [Nitriliruptorales bacterium]|nr:alpha/beta fold hydrolase [Nitriliruptorales bacterium]
MPTAVVDGIATEYEVVGSGPPLLLFSPGGFNATMQNWRVQGVYRTVKPLETLSRRFTCIAFDRREAGRSGGRVERITWSDYANQGAGLLDHLDIEQAHLMGGYQGCAPVVRFAADYPERTLSTVLFWPTGGARYRIRNHQQFAVHLAYAEERGLHGVVDLARSHDKGFSRDPRIGPWGPVLRHDESFAEQYVRQDPDRYALIVGGMVRGLIDRDTALGAEPEDLLGLDVSALVVPGQDVNHATSAARYLEECIPNAQYWDVPVAEQTEEATPARILEFLEGVEAARR